MPRERQQEWTPPQPPPIRHSRRRSHRQQDATDRGRPPTRERCCLSDTPGSSSLPPQRHQTAIVQENREPTAMSSHYPTHSRANIPSSHRSPPRIAPFLRPAATDGRTRAQHSPAQPSLQQPREIRTSDQQQKERESYQVFNTQEFREAHPWISTNTSTRSPAQHRHHSQPPIQKTPDPQATPMPDEDHTTESRTLRRRDRSRTRLAPETQRTSAPRQPTHPKQSTQRDDPNAGGTRNQDLREHHDQGNMRSVTTKTHDLPSKPVTPKPSPPTLQTDHTNRWSHMRGSTRNSPRSRPTSSLPLSSNEAPPSRPSDQQLPRQQKEINPWDAPTTFTQHHGTHKSPKAPRIPMSKFNPYGPPTTSMHPFRPSDGITSAPHDPSAWKQLHHSKKRLVQDGPQMPTPDQSEGQSNQRPYRSRSPLPRSTPNFPPPVHGEITDHRQYPPKSQPLSHNEMLHLECLLRVCRRISQDQILPHRCVPRSW